MEQLETTQTDRLHLPANIHSPARAEHSLLSFLTQTMDRGISARNLLPLTVLLGCCALLSSTAILPHPRSLHRLWKRQIPEYPPNIQLWGPFIPGMPIWTPLQSPSDALHDRSLWVAASDQPGKVHFDSGGDPGRMAAGELGKRRGILAADDAVFRERSRQLTALERKKWLQAYMQKLLVVNTD